jgi:hypothetical protein
MTKLGLVFVALTTVACGKGDKKASGTAAKPVDVAAVNALVPASLKDKLVFEEQKVVEDRGRRKTTYTVAAPKGWTQEQKSFATLRPPAELGRMTEFSVGTNCDGACEPKDWAATVEKAYSNQLSGKVLKDEKAPGQRTIITEMNGGAVFVVRAWWTDGDKRYSHCGGYLDEQLKDAAAAIEKACESITVTEE